MTTSGDNRWLIVGGVAVLALMSSVASLILYIQKPADPPRIVRADYVGIVRDYTLTLARRDLNEEQLAVASQKWSQEFTARLEAIALENNLIIMPSGLGYGVRDDITSELRDMVVTP